ncbi:hypothetical protein FaHV1S18_060 [Falconid herpesvirus 1]|uniref:Uncharacterized protein n=2 Tax=Columbid alphaherpesvirus 1 TaxID=93386 RepID=A0A068ES32_9ALPH|nr:hypothetical protein FaHV1S18_060 [Falconid herpesvirus 1]YP_009352954.1 hypothetical protein CoHVHLJ_060 [Columbid alphaherpesvirus 1]AID52750.1 hypothetical protein FaHV1S18_060 [Falconid herpesvirus 1]ARD71371.1 hypothetical protein CoHVHLJ_060 [Columbid alphaherpesvirus 1]
MSVYPDKELLKALDELAARGQRWLPSAVQKCIRRELGCATLMFSLEDGGLPLFSSVRVPWLLVWESLVWRMKKTRDSNSVPIASAGRAAISKDDETYGTAHNPTVVGLDFLDEVLHRLRQNSKSRHIAVEVDCGPCTPYTFQLIVWDGGLTGLVRVDEIRVDARYDMAWMVAEAGILTHYCAQRLETTPERLIVSIGRCLVPRWKTLNRSSIGMCAFIKQPRIIFRRVSEDAEDCSSGDVCVIGYTPILRATSGTLTHIRVKPSRPISRSLSISGKIDQINSRLSVYL